MRTQSKRFVVEVKRGTSRSSFTSPDTLDDKFSSAELALFGAVPKPSAAVVEAEERRPQGRVLRSLIEPPPPAVEEPEPPRRGRKPGSKNRPKADHPAAEPSRPSLASLSPEARAFAEPLPEAPGPRAPGPTDGAESSQSDGAPAAVGARQRLRDRSRIIRRYVLGIEPRVGRTEARRARRRAQADG